MRRHAPQFTVKIEYPYSYRMGFDTYLDPDNGLEPFESLERAEEYARSRLIPGQTSESTRVWVGTMRELTPEEGVDTP